MDETLSASLWTLVLVLKVAVTWGRQCPYLMDLGLRKKTWYWFLTAAKRNTRRTHALPSFTPPKEKSYVLLVLVSIDEITRAVKIGYGGVARVWCLVCTSF
jgi:hypothetical protein